MTHTKTMTRIQALFLAATAVVSTACSDKQLNISNPNSPTVEGAGADPQAFQLRATGILRQYRGSRTSFISDAGRFGRESYNFAPTEGRNTTAYLVGITGANKIDPAGFAGAIQWGTQYGNLRDIYLFKKDVPNNTNLSAAQASASLGFARTIEAAELLEVIAFKDSVGLITEIKDDPAELAAFVSRDSAYKYILNTLDQAATELAAGGAAFPFTLHSGFTGFNTPATFTQFNRALKARAAVWYASLGGGATAWNAALTALQGSFLNAAATTAAQMNAGVYHPYSTTTGDVQNSVSVTGTTNEYAHTSIQTDAQLKADGQPDNRLASKIRTGLPARFGPGPSSATSTIGFSIYATTATSLPIIRNEELILLRAEARLGTGDKAGAIADLNQVRTNVGGLPASTLTAASTTDQILDAILYEKRYSLLYEGHRWVDVRRYGRLNTLPLDIVGGANGNFRAKVVPVSQAECLARTGQTAPEMKGPGC